MGRGVSSIHSDSHTHSTIWRREGGEREEGREGEEREGGRGTGGTGEGRENGEERRTQQRENDSCMYMYSAAQQQLNKHT